MKKLGLWAIGPKPDSADIDVEFLDALCCFAGYSDEAVCANRRVTVMSP